MVPRRIVTAKKRTLIFHPFHMPARRKPLASSHGSYLRRAIHAPARKATSKKRNGALIVAARSWSAHRSPDGGSIRVPGAEAPCQPEPGRGLEVRSMPAWSSVSLEASVIAAACFMSMRVLHPMTVPTEVTGPFDDSYGGGIEANYMFVKDPAVPLP